MYLKIRFKNLLWLKDNIDAFKDYYIDKNKFFNINWEIYINSQFY